jgi:hypothetical protein
MDLTYGSNNVGRAKMLATSNNVRTGGYSTITYVSGTQIKVKLNPATINNNLYKVFRMGFRFYTPRLTTTTCTGVSVYTSRWGWNNFNSYSQSPGSFGVYCGNGGSNSRRFYAIFDMWYTKNSDHYPYQWPKLEATTDTYEFTFTFSSVAGDPVSNYPNYAWVSASMLWEESQWYYQWVSCGCCYKPCCSNCCNYCPNGFGGTYCCSLYCCSYCCQRNCDCRRILGYDYYTFTGTLSVGFSQSPKAIAGSTSIDLVSSHYGD